MQKKTDWFIFGEDNMGKREQTRKFIIEKAAIVFNQKGYAGTSMSDILAVTNLSKGAVYGCFSDEKEKGLGGKKAIAIAAFEYAVDTVTKSVRRRSLKQEKSYDKLFAAIDFYKEYIFNEPIEGGCPILNMAPEVDDTNPELRERVTKALDNWQYSIKRVVEKGIKKGEINPNIDAEEFSILFVATLEGGIMMSRIYNQSRHLRVVLKNLETTIKNELIIDK